LVHITVTKPVLMVLHFFAFGSLFQLMAVSYFVMMLLQLKWK